MTFPQYYFKDGPGESFTAAPLGNSTKKYAAGTNVSYAAPLVL